MAVLDPPLSPTKGPSQRPQEGSRFCLRHPRRTEPPPRRLTARPSATKEYARLIAEWRLHSNHLLPTTGPRGAALTLSVNELILAYLYASNQPHRSSSGPSDIYFDAIRLSG